jgi:hypothetical protein
MTTFPGVTQADIPALQAYLNANPPYGDRAGFYMKLYQLTGDAQALMQAQICTFSGIVGGLAFAANAQVQSEVPSQYPSGGVIQFSNQIAKAELQMVISAVNNGTGNQISNKNISDAARAAWVDSPTGDISQYFPGTLLDGSTLSYLANPSGAPPGVQADLQNLIAGMVLGTSASDYANNSAYTAHQLLNPDGSTELTYYTDASGKAVYVGDWPQLPASFSMASLLASTGDNVAVNGPQLTVVGILRNQPGMSFPP